MAGTRKKAAELEGVADERAAVPLWRQIFLQLRSQIYAGTLAANTLLPGETELARRFGVSTITAKRALDELARAHLVVRRAGDGTRVIHQAPVAPVEASVASALASARLIGRTRATVLSLGLEPPPPAIAAAMRIAPGTRVLRAERVRHFGEAPFAFVTSYVPAETCGDITAAELARTPLTALLAARGAGLAGGEQKLSATLAGPRVAGILDIDIGAPLLRVDAVMRDAGGQVVECFTALYRPDLYHFTIRLTGPAEEPQHG